MKKILFTELPLSEAVQQSVADMGFTEASAIQAQAIPFLLDGRDVIGQAQTGTGKTAAFGIPAIEKIDTNLKATQALILCPTRELAVQVAEEIKKLTKYSKGIFSTVVYGGVPITTQISALRRGVHIVIGTPGRVIDHIERGTLVLDELKMMVLDEADEMLNMGFREDIEHILEQTPAEKQTILFSATMAKPILDIARRFMNKPEMVKVATEKLTVSNISQFYFEVKQNNKLPLMTRLIDKHNLQLMLVFCNTKRSVDELTGELQELGHNAEALHGDLNQNQRNNVMRKFKTGNTNILVATDVAARGIDVDDVDAVFNFDIPLDEEAYVHRIGRTGRAGKSGMAFSFAGGGRDMYHLKDIQRYTKAEITKGLVPTLEDITNSRQAKTMDKIKQTIEAGGLEIYDKMIDKLSATDMDAMKIIAALLKMSAGDTNTKFNDVDFSSTTSFKERTSSNSFKDRNDRSSDRGFNSDRNSDRNDRGSFGNNRNDRDKKTYDRSSNNSDRKTDRTSNGGEKRTRTRNTDMTRLFFNIGRLQRVSPGDILGAITGEVGIKGSDIGNIDIFDKYSFVEVNPKDAQKVVEVMSTNSIKGKSVNVEFADKGERNN